MTKHNVIGWGLCILYTAGTATCWLMAYASNADPKGNFVLKQIPIAIQLALLDWLGLRSLAHNLSWFTAYAILFPLAILVLYGIGWLVSLPFKQRVG
jgi:hypothetical protein